MKNTATFTILLCIILASSGFALDPIPEDTPIQYLITTHVLSFTSNKDEKLEIVSSTATISKSPEASMPNNFTVITKMKLGQHTVEPDTNGRLLWDGQLKPPSNTPFQHLGSPKLLTLEGQKAKISQGDSIEYFEKISDNLYSLKTTPPEASPEISVEVVIRSQNDDLVEADFHTIFSVMTGRKKLPTTDLDIGEPILLKKENSSIVQARLREWFIPVLYSTDEDEAGNKEYLMILLMIDRI